MLTNFDLEQISDNMKLDLIGVFSKDMLPKERVAGSYIINLQDLNDGEGTHWVVFKIFDNGKACYFDSFGVYPPADINRFLMPFKPIATNNRQIQDIKSIRCGYFCLAFIDFFNNFDTRKNDVYEAYDDFLNCFSNNKKMNDKIILELLNR